MIRHFFEIIVIPGDKKELKQFHFLPHEPLQLRQKHHALLLVRVGAADDSRRRSGAGVEGQVGHACWDVEEVSGHHLHPMLQPLAPVHHRDTLQHVDRGLVRRVFVRLGAAARRDRQQVHADAGRAHGFGGNPGVVGKALLAIKGIGRAQFLALGHGKLRMDMGLRPDYHGAIAA